MLIVETFIAASNIQGVGLFSKVPIEKGTVISIFKPSLEIYVNESHLTDYPEITQEFIKHQSFYLEKYRYYLLPCGNERFINHSSNNNLTLHAEYKDFTSGEPNCIVAIIDIPSGKELLLDYKQFSEQQYMRVVEHVERRDAKIWPPKVKIK